MRGRWRLESRNGEKKNLHNYLKGKKDSFRGGKEVKKRGKREKETKILVSEAWGRFERGCG
jgi:hypothetical protein